MFRGKSVSSLLAAGEYAWSVPSAADAPLRYDAVSITRSLLHGSAPPYLPHRGAH